MAKKTTGNTILTPSVQKYLEDWLAIIEAKNSSATAERYGHTVDLLLEYLKDGAKLPMTAIASPHIEGFLSWRLKQNVTPKTAIAAGTFRKEIPGWPEGWVIFHAEGFSCFYYLLSGGAANRHFTLRRGWTGFEDWRSSSPAGRGCLAAAA